MKRIGTVMMVAVAGVGMALAGCDGRDKGPEKPGDGRVAFELPNAKAEFNLPSALIRNGDFDIDGVKMMPGGTISGIDLKAANTNPVVSIGFRTPAAPEATIRYFRDQFTAKGIDTKVAGNALDGRSKDGDTFTMTFAPSAEGTQGTLRMMPKPD